MSSDNNYKNKSKNENLISQFMAIANPDEDGFSREVTMEELIAINPDFKLGNGGGWCRGDGSLKKYHIKRKKEKNKIVSVKLNGKNLNPKERAIDKNIRSAVIKQPCAVLGINSGIECDHKNGMYDDRGVADPKSQKVNDFQPLSRSVNLAKRTHCKKCEETGVRFDAKQLGYSESYLKGDINRTTCVGCYWYDPQKFNFQISKDFKKII